MFGMLFTQLARVAGFGYDATEPKNKRRDASGLLRAEDDELTALKRRQLLSQARDLQRDFVVAAWMIRQHLNYTANHTFHAKTANRDANRLIEDRIRKWSAPRNCDVTERHPFSRFIRLAECRRILDGDLLVLRLRDGRLQAVEGDRIRDSQTDPRRGNRATTTHGVVTNGPGAATHYSICRRGTAGGFEFERLVAARDGYLHGFFDRFDQVRGVSPLAPAINTLVDTYEAFDYALAKIKVSQLFALAFYRGDEKAIVERDTEAGQDYSQIPFGSGPVMLDLDLGDRAEFLESRQPSNEFQAFTQLMIQLSLKALDIPYSFFSENFTNYSGARQALIQYEESAKIRREEVRWLLDWITAWRLQLIIDDGELPPSIAETLAWEWVPSSLPWIDPLKEMQANSAAIGEALDSRTRILKTMGRDFEDVVDQLAAENALLAARGIKTTSTSTPTQDAPAHDAALPNR